jgi:hypothetical protein
MRHDKIIYTSMAALFVLSAASFFIAPSYERGAWLGILTFSNVLSYAAGSKSALAQPDPQKIPEGMEQTTKQTTETVKSTEPKA